MVRSRRQPGKPAPRFAEHPGYHDTQILLRGDRSGHLGHYGASLPAVAIGREVIVGVCAILEGP